MNFGIDIVIVIGIDSFLCINIDILLTSLLLAKIAILVALLKTGTA